MASLAKNVAIPIPVRVKNPIRDAAPSANRKKQPLTGPFFMD